MRISDWSSDVCSSDLLDYVADLFSEENLRASGLFDVEATTRLFAKARAGRVVGFADNQAFVGVLSTLLLLRQRPAPGSAGGGWSTVRGKAAPLAFQDLGLRIDGVVRRGPDVRPAPRIQF